MKETLNSPKITGEGTSPCDSIEDSEIVQELKQLSANIETLDMMAQELDNRLTSVLAPDATVDEPETKQHQRDSQIANGLQEMNLRLSALIAKGRNTAERIRV